LTGRGANAAANQVEWFAATHRIFQVLVLASYVLMLVVSCLIRERELLKTTGTFRSEARVACIAGMTIPKEVPWDLIGWIVVVVIAILPVILRASRVSDDLSLLYLPLIYASPFVYAIIRRVITARRERAAA
jgi:hypothetical protein